MTKMLEYEGWDFTLQKPKEYVDSILTFKIQIPNCHVHSITKMRRYVQSTI